LTSLVKKESDYIDTMKNICYCLAIWYISRRKRCMDTSHKSMPYS